jgi:guanosine-3',5'-bis(diphosphate) 3'-pyrophosphohydrolase
MPLDFACAVHGVGSYKYCAVDGSWCRCVQARRRQRVGYAAVVGAETAMAGFVVSGKARTSSAGAQLGHEDAVQLGHRMLDRALEALGYLAGPGAGRAGAYLPAPVSQRGAARRHRWATDAAQVAGRWRAMRRARAARRPGLGVEDKILITGAERGVISFANCCLPVPGDEIMGYHTAGKGIVVHRLDLARRCVCRCCEGRWRIIAPAPGSALKGSHG